MDVSASDCVLVTVDGRTASVPRGTTILDAARQMGVSIPTLCNYRGLAAYGACRVCLVEIETPRGGQLVASCSYPVEEQLAVHTETERVKESRRTVLELLLAQASDWAFMISGAMAEYGRKRTETHLARFQKLCEEINGPQIDEAFLANVESLDNIFPQIDYQVFS
jgi:ferredoxin